MEKTKHQVLIGEGAENFAKEQGLEFVTQEWLSTDRRVNQLKRAKEAAVRLAILESSPLALIPSFQKPVNKGPIEESKEDAKGTVGVVVRDSYGRLAAATSTGGLSNKMHGRVGDTPLVGCGNYANGFAAVSGTGTGEVFMRNWYHFSAVDSTEPSLMNGRF